MIPCSVYGTRMPLLFGMGIRVPYTEHGIMVRDGQMGHARTAGQKRHLFRRGRPVGESSMGMQIAWHSISPFWLFNILLYSFSPVLKRPLPGLRRPLPYFIVCA